MTVNELITQLEEVENKGLQVFAWSSESDTSKIVSIEETDERIDINLGAQINDWYYICRWYKIKL